MSLSVPSSPLSISDLQSLSHQCTDVVAMISKYGSYYKFEIVHSVPIQGLTSTQSARPSDICQASPDHIFVSFMLQDLVCRFNSRGELIWRRNVLTPVQMCVTNDELCVVARNENSINIYSFDGILQRRIETQLPMGVVFDKERNQIVVGSMFCMQAFSMLNDKNSPESVKRFPDTTSRELWRYSGKQSSAQFLAIDQETGRYSGTHSSDQFLGIDQETGNIFVDRGGFHTFGLVEVFNSKGVFQYEMGQNNFNQRQERLGQIFSFCANDPIVSRSTGDIFKICCGTPSCLKITQERKFIDTNGYTATTTTEETSATPSIFTKCKLCPNCTRSCFYLVTLTNKGILKDLKHLKFQGNFVFNTTSDGHFIFLDSSHFHFVC